MPDRISSTTYAYSIAFVGLLLAMGCETPAEPEELIPDEPMVCLPSVAGQFEPFAEGNYWERVQHVYGGGDLMEAFTDTGRIAVEEVRSISVDGEVYSAGVVRVILPGEVPELVSIPKWNGPDGLYTLGLFARDDTMLTPPQLRYKYPVEVGEEWPVTRIGYNPSDGKISVRDTLIYKAVATEEPFETPTDTFETVVYHYYARQAHDVAGFRHTFQFYAPGVGPIGSEIYATWDSTYSFQQRDIQDLDYRLTLVDYCIQ